MEKQYLVLLMLEGLHIPDCSHGHFFLSVAFWACTVSLNIMSSKNFKSHGANVYKGEQFPFLISGFLVVIGLFVLISVPLVSFNLASLEHGMFFVALNPILVLKFGDARSYQKE